MTVAVVISTAEMMAYTNAIVSGLSECFCKHEQITIFKTCKHNTTIEAIK